MLVKTGCNSLKVVGMRKRQEFKQTGHWGTSLEVQWLGLHASTAGGAGSIPGRGNKFPHAAQHGQKMKKKRALVNPYPLTFAP